MVIANAGLIGNCLLLSVKGMSESLGDTSILGSHTHLSTREPAMTSVSMIDVVR